ncbi:transposase [Aneurinibacillus migulanus]|nr:transposase [Aneurinibacillus migulanus]
MSRSGYYRWLRTEKTRCDREEADEKDYQLIKGIYDAKKGRAGVRTIKMELENRKNVVMNHKRIRRIMRKYNLVAKIRCANPYKKMAQATHEHKIRPTLLKRNFDQGEPQKVFLTDITYLFYGNGKKAYLSCVKDGATREIVAYHLSESLQMELVYRTLDKLAEQLDHSIHPEAILHSDQGVHYTNPAYQKRIIELGLTPSMSRKGNCWDNAPIESFFCHMKDEMEYTRIQSFNELKKCVEAYIERYNYYRCQWTLEKLTPVEYRNQLLAA